MDPNIQLLLDEIKSVKTAVNGIKSRVSAVETLLGSRISAMDRSISDRFGRVEGAIQVFDDWRPSVDASVEELRSEVSTLRKQEGAIEKMREEMTALRKSVSRVVLEAAPPMAAGILAQPVVSAATSSAGHPVTGPAVGHRVEPHHREFGSLTPLPVKGTLDFKSHPFPKAFSCLRRSLLSPQIATDERLFVRDIEGVHGRYTQLGSQ